MSNMSDEEFQENYDRIVDGRNGGFHLLYPDAPEYEDAIKITNEPAFEREWRERIAMGTCPDAEFCLVLR